MPTKTATTSQHTPPPAAPPIKRIVAPKAVAPVKKTPRKKSETAGPAEILFKGKPYATANPAPPFIWIDHPQQGEKLMHAHYTVRLGVGGAEAVEISVDKREWRHCRHAAGYWWYDWNDIAAGKHTLVARLRTSSGQWYKTPPRAIER